MAVRFQAFNEIEWAKQILHKKAIENLKKQAKEENEIAEDLNQKLGQPPEKNLLLPFTSNYELSREIKNLDRVVNIIEESSNQIKRNFTIIDPNPGPGKDQNGNPIPAPDPIYPIIPGMLDNSNFNDFYKNAILLIEYQKKISRTIQQLKESTQLYSQLLGKKLQKVFNKINNIENSIEFLYLKDIDGDVINEYKFSDPLEIKRAFPEINESLDKFIQIYFPFPKSNKDFRNNVIVSISTLLSEIFDNFQEIISELSEFVNELTSRYGAGIGFRGGTIHNNNFKDNFRHGGFITPTREYIKHNDDDIPQRYR